MSIIPISRLHGTDLALLGNNIVAAGHRSPRRSRRRRSELAPVNRSLSLVGEKVDCLYPLGLDTVRPSALRPPI